MAMRCMVIIAALFCAGCDYDPARAVKAIEDYGFVSPVLTGRRVLGCGQQDTYRMGFTARNVHGKYVSGVVCTGPAAGWTVRLDG